MKLRGRDRNNSNICFQPVISYFCYFGYKAQAGWHNSLRNHCELCFPILSAFSKNKPGIFSCVKKATCNMHQNCRAFPLPPLLLTLLPLSTAVRKMCSFGLLWETHITTAKYLTTTSRKETQVKIKVNCMGSPCLWLLKNRSLCLFFKMR